MNVKNGKPFKIFLSREQDTLKKYNYITKKTTYIYSLKRIDIYIEERDITIKQIRNGYGSRVNNHLTITIGEFLFERMESDYMLCETIKNNPNLHDLMKEMYPFKNNY